MDLAIEQAMMRAVKARGGLTRGRGMTESVRSLWIHSMHQCASMHAAISSFSGCDLASDDTYHVELGKSRVQRDFADLNKVLEWFVAHNPFHVSDGRLRSISSGVVAEDADNITCDVAEELGQTIMMDTDDKAYTDTVIRRKSQVRTLGYLNRTVKIGKNHVVIDPDILFTRLLIVVTQSGNTESCFHHELTTVPTSLFKGEGFRKTDRSVLAKELTKSVVTSEMCFTGKYVVDGGCLLHRVVWPKTGTYGDITYHT